MNSIIRSQQASTIDALLKVVEDDGRLLYSKNATYNQLGNVMEHPGFQEFFEKYLSQDSLDRECMLKFMDTYYMLGKGKYSLTPYQKLGILKRLIDNGVTRRKIINTNLVNNTLLTLT